MTESFHPPDEHVSFISTLEKQVADVANPQSRARVDARTGTIIFAISDGEEPDMPVRITGLGQLADDGPPWVRYEVFGQDGNPIHDEIVPLSEMRVAQVKEVEFPEDATVSDELRATFAGRKVRVRKGIQVVDMEQRKDLTVGRGDSAFSLDDPDVHGARIVQADGTEISFFTRTGKADDGEGLEGEDVRVLTIKRPDGTVERIVDLAKDVEAEAMAGDRFIFRHKRAIGAAAVVATGVVVTAYRLGRSRFIK